MRQWGLNHRAQKRANLSVFNQERRTKVRKCNILKGNGVAVIPFGIRTVQWRAVLPTVTILLFCVVTEGRVRKNGEERKAEEDIWI